VPVFLYIIFWLTLRFTSKPVLKMKFLTLENQTVSTLCELFNQAFTDYFVKIELTPEMLLEKFESEDVDLSLSAGAFFEEKPVAFIFHAVRENKAYNAGTGVIPEFRGKNTTSLMYEFIRPKLKSAGVEEVVLEVIDKNTPAIKSYEKAGFYKMVDLDCYKGKIKGMPVNHAVQVKKLSAFDFDLAHNFWDWQPTWQHSTQTINQLANYTTFGAFLNDKPVGYLVVNLQKGRVVQFAVHHDYRRQGIGTELFRFVSENYDLELQVMNVDGNSKETASFLKNMNLELFITQYKMKLELNKQNK